MSKQTILITALGVIVLITSVLAERELEDECTDKSIHSSLALLNGLGVSLAILPVIILFCEKSERACSTVAVGSFLFLVGAICITVIVLSIIPMAKVKSTDIKNSGTFYGCLSVNVVLSVIVIGAVIFMNKRGSFDSKDANKKNVPDVVLKQKGENKGNSESWFSTWWKEKKKKRDAEQKAEAEGEKKFKEIEEKTAKTLRDRDEKRAEEKAKADELKNRSRMATPQKKPQSNINNLPQPVRKPPPKPKTPQKLNVPTAPPRDNSIPVAPPVQNNSPKPSKHDQKNASPFVSTMSTAPSSSTPEEEKEEMSVPKNNPFDAIFSSLPPPSFAPHVASRSDFDVVTNKNKPTIVLPSNPSTKPLKSIK